MLAHQMHRPRHLQSPEGAQHRGGPQGSESRQLLGCDHHRGKDLADCHQKKTLQPLWTINFGHSFSSVLDASKRDEVVHLLRSLKAHATLGEAEVAAGQRWPVEVVARSPPTRGLLAGWTTGRSAERTGTGSACSSTNTSSGRGTERVACSPLV